MTDAAHLRLRADLRARVKGCQGCSLHTRCKAPVPWRGPIQGAGEQGSGKVRLAVLGEAPGREEDKANKPFVGPSGKLVDHWLRDVVTDPWNKLDVDNEVSFVNAVSCYPSRTPSTTEIEACRPTLHAQLAAIDPEFVLVLGGVAVSSFWRNVRIGDIRGRWWGLPLIAYPRTITDGLSTFDVVRYVPAIATWHPAAVLRGNGADDVLHDLHLLRMVLFREAVGPYEEHSCFMCGTDDMKNERWLACDLGLGRDVTNEKGAPLALCICEKHDRQRFGKIEQVRRKTAKAAAKTKGKVGLFDG